MPFHRLAIAAAAAFSFAGLSTAAQAVVVNIDATTSASVSQDFAAGTYYVSLIGTSQGGLYDGWTYKIGSQYREAFSFTLNGDTYSVDVYNGSTKFTSYASPSTAQTSFATGPYAIYAGSSDGNLVSTLPSLELTLAAPATISFSVPDNKFDDNSGGVSLSVTSAVPEPETYALMLAGLAGMGFIAKRRRPA